MRRVRGREDKRGIVVFESVLWLMTLMPFMIVACFLATVAYNRNMLRVISEAVVNEQELPGLRLEGGASGVYWVVNEEALLGGLARMVDAAVERARATTLQTSTVSAKGCVSVFIVEESSGRIVGERDRRCDARGAESERLDVEGLLNSYYGRVLGIPLRRGHATSQFIDRLVVVGLSVGVEMNEVTKLFGERYVEYGATGVPRQEVVL